MALMPVCSGYVDRLAPGDAGGVGFDQPAFGGGDRAAAVQADCPAGRSRGPSTASPTGTESSRPVLRTSSPSLIERKSPRMMTPTEFSSRLKARPLTPPAAGEFDHFARHHAGQSVDAGDAVADLDHAADLADVDARLELLNFLLDDGSDLVGFEFHGRSCR